MEDLGRTLASDLQCLVSAAQHLDFCAPFDRLRLNLASLQVQTGNLTDGGALPQDQFGRLLRSEFAAALFRTTPALLNLTNAAGAPAVDTVGSVSAASPAAGESVGGEIHMQFEFAPP